MKFDKLTIVGGIIFLGGIIGHFIASAEIKANPFKYGLSMLEGKSDPIIIIAQFGIYVGLIGLGLSVFGIYKASKKPNNIAENNSTKTCPQCAEIIKTEARICRFCSFKFTENAPVPAEVKKDNVTQKTSEAADNDKKPLSPSNFRPLSEFSNHKNIAEEKLIKMIREGFYNGTLIDGEWHVHNNEFI